VGINPVPYYSAIESGVRYRIDEAGEEVAAGVALKKIAARATLAHGLLSETVAVTGVACPELNKG